MFSNLMYMYFGWCPLRFVHFMSKSQNLYFRWIFLVKINIFNFFFKTVSQNVFKFDVQVPWVVPSQICSFCVKILNSLFLANIFVIFGQNWYFRLLLQNCKSECFQIQYTSTLGGSLPDLFILYQNIMFSIFGKNLYFHLYFKCVKLVHFIIQRSYISQ